MWDLVLLVIPPRDSISTSAWSGWEVNLREMGLGTGVGSGIGVYPVLMRVG